MGLREKLKLEIIDTLIKQGYEVKDNIFHLPNLNHNKKRSVHSIAKNERLARSKNFLLKNTDLVKKFLINQEDIEVNKIDPQLIEVVESTKWEILFRWWNLIWWSLPYEHAYGRQMRFIVWDNYHEVPIGLIGLQSPILRWSVRDNYLGISPKLRDFWVNQSMNAQRLGAIPPYNNLLGGKLVALLMTSNSLRKRFKEKYENVYTILMHRKLPANLIFITTTGAYGKSSIYNRLRYKNDTVANFIGYTKGSGTFHVPNYLFEEIVKFLKYKRIDVKRGYGSGPSSKLHLIDRAFKLLGFKNGANHGISRAVYLFPLVSNLKELIRNNSEPIWYVRKIEDLTIFWKKRWAVPRANRLVNEANFNSNIFLEQTINNIKEL